MCGRSPVMRRSGAGTADALRRPATPWCAYREAAGNLAAAFGGEAVAARSGRTATWAF